MDYPIPPLVLREIRARLFDLEQRVEQLERARAGAATPPPATLVADETQTVPPPEPRTAPTEFELSFASASQSAPPIAPPSGPPEVQVVDRESIARPEAQPALEAFARRAAAPRTTSQAPQEDSPDDQREGSLANIDWNEQLAGRWYTYAGAIVLVIGVVLGLKWAYDIGLLRISPTGRCLAAAGLGILLIEIGRRMRPRVGDWGAAALFGAGLGSIYAAGYAACEMYHLVGPGSGLLLLAGVGVLGVGVSLLSGLASVGVLSIIGAAFGPVLLWQYQGPVWSTPLYLILLLGAGTAVGAIRSGPFRFMRDVAMFAALGLGTLWSIRAGHSYPGQVIAFLIAIWVLVQAEMFRVAHRGAPVSGLRGEPGHRLDVIWNAGTLLSSAIASLWAGVLAYHAGSDAGWRGDWVVAAAIAGGCAGLGAFLAPLRRQTEPALPVSSDSSGSILDSARWPTLVGAGFWLQAGVLLLVTVFMATSGIAEVALWAGLGCCAAVLSKLLRQTALAWYALLAFLILSIRGAGLGANPASPLFDATHLLTLTVSWRSVCLVVAALGLMRAAWQRDQLSRRARLLPFVGVGSALILALSPEGDTSGGMGVLFAWIGLAFVFVLAARRPWGTDLGPAAVAALGLALLRWVAAFIAEGWDRPAWPLLLHPALVSAGLLALAAGPIWRLPGVDEKVSRSALFIAMRRYGNWISAVLLLVATSMYINHVGEFFEIRSDARSALISLWWGLSGFSAVMLGFVRRRKSIRWTGLCLLGAGAAKAVFIDLTDVSTLWRVVSFLALGVLLMFVGMGYQWVERQLSRQAGNAAASDPR